MIDFVSFTILLSVEMTRWLKMGKKNLNTVDIDLTSVGESLDQCISGDVMIHSMIVWNDRYALTHLIDVKIKKRITSVYRWCIVSYSRSFHWYLHWHSESECHSRVMLCSFFGWMCVCLKNPVTDWCLRVAGLKGNGSLSAQEWESYNISHCCDTWCRDRYASDIIV